MIIALVFNDIPDESNAGFRIRYKPVIDFLEKLGHEIHIKSINEDLFSNNYNFVIFIKCYNFKSVLIANDLSKRGVFVGVDLFDNYFSDFENINLKKFRIWLKRIIGHCSFVICSTNLLLLEIKSYIGSTPVYIMNDSVEKPSYQIIEELVKKKIKWFIKNKTVNIAWYGMGDNPYFDVGLDDLISYIGEIERLQYSIYNLNYIVSLEILTNKRALTLTNLKKLNGLNIKYTIHEWTKEKEDELLTRALLVFLPVSYQAFSKVKSLNRALTALCSGANVFSVGFPLYQCINSWIYTDGDNFIKDLSKNELKLNNFNIKKMLTDISKVSDVELEAVMLTNYLNSVKLRGNSKNYLYITHKNPDIKLHKILSKHGHISAATEFCNKNFNFDLQINKKDDFYYIISNEKTFKLFPQIIKKKFSLSAKEKMDQKCYYCKLEDLMIANNYDEMLQIANKLEVNSNLEIISSLYSEIYKTILPGFECIFDE
jgi:hypothetical protein